MGRSSPRPATRWPSAAGSRWRSSRRGRGSSASPGSGTRVLCEDYLAEHGIRPRLLTLGSNGAIKQAARVGLGVALQSRAAVELEVSLGLLATIRPRGGLPHRSWYVVRATTGPVRDVVDAFMAYVESPAARHALGARADAGVERAAVGGGGD